MSEYKKGWPIDEPHLLAQLSNRAFRALSRKPMEVPRHWRLQAQRYRLEGSACPICGRLTFPPRMVCHDCTGQLARISGREHEVIPSSNRAVDTHLSVEKIGGIK
jgi:hypothetical protein